jgi:hypothetical protein
MTLVIHELPDDIAALKRLILAERAGSIVTSVASTAPSSLSAVLIELPLELTVFCRIHSVRC